MTTPLLTDSAPGAATGSDPVPGRDLTRPSPWSPFGRPLFRNIWIATVASSTGGWVHDVGAAWLMTSLAPSPLMVSLVQTATTLPVLLLALIAGTMADVFDRRWLLILAQVWMAMSALALGVLTIAGATTPWLLLVLTFSLGLGTALSAPAWQSVVPELVPRTELPAAVTLNSAGINVSRAAGPALGGVLVSVAGAGAAFLVNAVSFIGVVAVLARWRREPAATALPRERFAPAFGTGVRYVRNSPRLIAVLVRTFAFIFFASGLWALLPLVARTQLGAGAAGYGLLLTAIGVGALSGTLLLPRVRTRLSPDALVVVGTCIYAGVVALAAVLRTFSPLLIALLAGGAAWLALLSTFQTAIQLSVPSWIRGRVLAFYLMIFFGGQAGGALIWGAFAEIAGVPPTLLLTSVGLMAGLLTTRRFPIGSLERQDMSPSRHWADPSVGPDSQPHDAQVLVVTEYVVRTGDAQAFVRAMQEVRGERLRDGAVRWELFRDVESETYTEQFIVPSWLEHLRQHERVTEMDRAAQERVLVFHQGPRPVVRHYIAVNDRPV